MPYCQNSLLEQALTVAVRYPVFPVRITPRNGGGADKRPALSNVELGRLRGKPVMSGQGGHNAATQDPALVRAMFEAASAGGGQIEIGVPMASSGLLALDFDLYKQGEATAWVERHWPLLEPHRRHRTMSGGLHVICLALKGMAVPGKVADLPDAEVKHKGFIVWPRAGNGYTIQRDVDPLPMQLELIQAAFGSAARHRGGPSRGGNFAHNPMPDTEVEARILSGEDYHASLLTLSMRMAIRGDDVEEVERRLRALLAQSKPSDPERQVRLAQLLDPRGSELRRMCESAVAKTGDAGGNLAESLTLEGHDIQLPNAVNGSHELPPQADWRQWFEGQR